MPNLKHLKKALVSVPHRSGFDKSHRNLFTAKCGTLVPIMCDEVLPNTDVHLNLALSAKLPPLASETFMNVNYKVEAFFCPTRLLMAGYEDWLTGNDTKTVGSGSSATTDYIRTPLWSVTSNTSVAGTLADYLNVKRIDGVEVVSGEMYVSAFPALCYHLVYDTWYRNSLVQKSLFQNSFEWKMENPSIPDAYVPATIQWCTPRQSDNEYIITQTMTFANGDTINTLHQRNFGSDYFTVATPKPQNGDAQKVSMVLPTSIYVDRSSLPNASISDAIFTNSGGGFINLRNNVTEPISFTINALRSANSMQQFLERSNLCGNRLVDYVKGQYGANLRDSIAQRPVYLGSMSIPVYSKGVYQSAAPDSSVSTNNPFDTVGSRYGDASAESSGHLIDYHADEPGYIIVIGSLVPEVNYSTGVDRSLFRYTQRSSQSDMANPILQNVGQQPIYLKELSSKAAWSVGGLNPDYVFGYVDRYADWMTRQNEVHGLIKDGESLQAFALQRSVVVDVDQSVNNFITISSDFLEIPTDFMDQVTAVDSQISDYGVWVDSWLDYKVSMPLYEYSVPSLQDPAYEHGNTFLINRGGRNIE